jgi:hypothetical protein
MIKNLKLPNYSDIINRNNEPKCQIIINFFSNEKDKTSIPKNSQKHLISDEIIDFKNETINIDSLDSSTSILKLFVLIDGKKLVNAVDQKQPNFYIIKLKDYEVKNDYHELNLKLMDNIEINLLLKVKNIIGGSSFKDRMNIFQKKTTILPSENPSNAIITGINMKDRLKLFNSTNYSSSNYSKSKTVIISNKSNQPIIEKPEKNNDNKNLINKEKKIEEKN